MNRPLLCALALSLGLTGAAGRLAPAYAGEGDSPDDLRRELEGRLARAELLAGLTPVEGPGVVIRLRNSPRSAPRGVDPKALRVQEQDFNAILNVLRIAGAEAIGIGGGNTTQLERVTAATAARESWNGLVVHGVTLQQPFRIMAIGDAQKIRAELLRAGGVVKKAGLDVLEMIELEDQELVSLPAARGASEFRFARSGSGEAASPEVQPEPASPRPQPLTPAAQVKETPAPLPAPPVRMASGEPRITGITRRPQSGSAVAPVPQPRVIPTPLPPPPGPTPYADDFKPKPQLLPKVDPEPQPELRPELEPEAQPEPKPTRPEPKPEVKPEPKPEPKPQTKAEPKPAVTRPAQKPAGKQTAGAAIFGGRGLAKFHLAGCRYGERIEAGQRVFFSSAKEATQKGRTACPICHESQ